MRLVARQVALVGSGGLVERASCAWRLAARLKDSGNWGLPFILQEGVSLWIFLEATQLL